MSHEKFPPELVSTLRAELDANPGGSFESRQVLITGPMGITIWARTHGSKTYELSTRAKAHSSLPMGTLIVATTSPSEYATLDGFRVSDDSTYVDGDNRIVVIDSGQEDVQTSFTFITSVGLYDVNDNCLAVAKLSRPVEKNSERDLTLRVRLDF